MLSPTRNQRFTPRAPSTVRPVALRLKGRAKDVGGFGADAVAPAREADLRCADGTGRVNPSNMMSHRNDMDPICSLL